MSRKSKSRPSDESPQLSLNFDDVIRTAEVLSRDEVERKASPQDYDPIALTTEYMKRAVEHRCARVVLKLSHRPEAAD
jgi:hypothetical protein